MKYFKKFLILGLFSLCGVSFCNASTVTTYTQIELICDNGSCNSLINAPSQPFIIKGNEDTEIYCQIAEYSFTNNNTNITDNPLTIGISGITPNTISFKEMELTDSGNGFEGNVIINYEEDLQEILYGNFNTGYNASYLGLSMYPNIDNNSEIGTIYLGCILSGNIYSTIEEISGNNNQSCPTCPSCPDQYTSLECQTEYNLIPISEVTENYCTVNFDLISPLDCPSSPSGSGEVSRSALYVNNVQYNGAPNLYVNINDLLDYSMTYVSGSAVIDVDGYKADTGYMSDILIIQEYHPSSEDFTVAFVSVLTYALPYVIVALFVLFIWKLIKKIFKS